MSVDIGPKIGIDGEAEFRKQLGNINQQLKTLGSEMKAVTSAFEAGDRSEEALGARTEILNRQIGAQEAKLEQLRKGLSAAAEKYGENDTKTLRWAQAVNDATADLNKLRAQLAQTEGELDDVADATGEVTDAMDGASDASGGLGDAIKGAILGGGIVETIRGAAGAVGDLVESTTEYRRIMGSLDVSSERAGYNALETAESYKQLYGVLADDQTTAPAVSSTCGIWARRSSASWPSSSPVQAKACSKPPSRKASTTVRALSSRLAKPCLAWVTAGDRISANSAVAAVMSAMA